MLNDAVLRQADIVELAEVELEKLQQDLNSIFTLVDKINQADTDNIQPMAHPLEVHQRLREDEVTQNPDREALQSLSDNCAQGLYLVPQVIE